MRNGSEPERKPYGRCVLFLFESLGEFSFSMVTKLAEFRFGKTTLFGLVDQTFSLTMVDWGTR